MYNVPYTYTCMYMYMLYMYSVPVGLADPNYPDMSAGANNLNILY